ncbi:MAG: class I SAM-dependent methyltransferase [Bacteroidetes bacterium]|nr:class I SAM-dependent methyltransferase [Bacteroidota bacterium]
MKKLKELIKRIFGKNFIHKVESYVFSGDLDKLAQIYNTDKFGRHMYTPIYTLYFRKIRRQKLKILEIGVGGYDNPTAGGASLKMWKRYFTKSNITAIDIYDKKKLEENRVKIFRGSQDDYNFLMDVNNTQGPFDIIIDDGSHINNHVINSFNYLFPILKKGGIYVVEDTETSYQEDMGGNSKQINNVDTTMNYFKNLVDAVNHKEFDNRIFKAVVDIEQVKSIHFYHNLIFIFKA